MKISVNARYIFLQGVFWMMFCAGTGFVSMFLQGRGLGPGAIGTVTAFFGLAAAVLQPILGRLCDRHAALTWRSMLLILCVPFPVICLLLFVISGAWAGGILMGMLILLSNVMMPFVNSANFYYVKIGERVNFNIARAVGSALYAIIALALGKTAARFGNNVLLIAGAIISAIFMFVTLAMPCRTGAEDNGRETTRSKKGFMRRYPAFTLMLAASLVMLTSHNTVNTYLLQIFQTMGGGSGELGTALAIQAIVEVPVIFLFFLVLRRFKPESMMMATALGYALKAVMYALSRSITMIYLTQLTQIVSFAVFASASVYYAAESVDESDRMTGQAFMTSTIAAGTVLGGLIGGWLIELKGIPFMLGVNIATSFVGVLLAALSLRMGRSKIKIGL